MHKHAAPLAFHTTPASMLACLDCKGFHMCARTRERRRSPPLLGGPNLADVASQLDMCSAVIVECDWQEVTPLGQMRLKERKEKQSAELINSNVSGIICHIQSTSLYETLLHRPNASAEASN